MMLQFILLTSLATQLPGSDGTASHEAIESLLTELRRLINEGQVTDAATSIPEAIRLAKGAEVDAIDAALLWNQVGLIHDSLGMPGLAEGEYRTGLRVLAGRSDSLAEALLLLNLAGVLLNIGGRPREVELLLIRGLEVVQKLAGDRSRDRLVFLIALAAAKSELGDRVAARKLLSEVLESGDQTLLARLQRAAALSGLGVMAANERKFPQAIHFFLESIAVFDGVYGMRHPDTIPLYLNLAFSYGREHRWDRAGEVAGLALEIAESRLSPNRPLLAKALKASAEAERHMGKRAAAKVLEARARSLTGDSDNAVIRARVHVADLRGGAN